MNDYGRCHDNLRDADDKVVAQSIIYIAGVVLEHVP